MLYALLKSSAYNTSSRSCTRTIQSTTAHVLQPRSQSLYNIVNIQHRHHIIRTHHNPLNASNPPQKWPYCKRHRKASATLSKPCGNRNLQTAQPSCSNLRSFRILGSTQLGEIIVHICSVLNICLQKSAFKKALLQACRHMATSPFMHAETFQLLHSTQLDKFVVRVS